MQLSPGVPAYFKPPLFGFPTAKGAGSWYGGLKWGLEGKPNNGWCAREHALKKHVYVTMFGSMPCSDMCSRHS